MQGIVRSDYKLFIGGPAQIGQKLVATFAAGEILMLERVHRDGALVSMYTIAGLTGFEISRGILQEFIVEFT